MYREYRGNMSIDKYEKNDLIVEYDGINVNRGKVIDVQGNKVSVQWKPYSENNTTVEKITPIFKEYDDAEEEVIVENTVVLDKKEVSTKLGKVSKKCIDKKINATNFNF